MECALPEKIMNFGTKLVETKVSKKIDGSTLSLHLPPRFSRLFKVKNTFYVITPEPIIICIKSKNKNTLSRYFKQSCKTLKK